MFTQKDTTKTSRKIAYAVLALVGTACIALGIMGSVSVNEEVDHVSLLNSLMEHHEFHTSKFSLYDQLKAENMQNMRDTHASIEDLLTSLKTTKFRAKTAPAIKKGVEQLKSNTKTSEKTSKNMAKPEELKKTFGDAARLNAEVHAYFPSEGAKIEKLKTQLKLHHF